MKKLILLALIYVFSISAIFAQGQELSDNLPFDPKVKIGQLDNGMMYYIRQNAVPEKRAELWLAVNIGSVLENEQELGLAHFTEHMAFNGSKHFTKNDLIVKLEEIGMKFGQDLNAFTSFDETVYTVTVPSDKDEHIDLGLLILNDVAHELSFDSTAVEGERGVIQEEWRMNQGAMMRVQNNMLKAMFNGSKYAERLPIGTMEVVMNFKRETIVNFYKTWYRPELMAVIAVGDFDVAVMEGKIKDLFGKIEKSAVPTVRPVETIPDNTDPIVKISSDPECPQTIIEILYKHDLSPYKTVADFREGLIDDLITQMLTSRFMEKALQPNPPFVQAAGAYSDFMAGKDAFMNYAVLKDDKIENAITELVTENQRMLQHGFLETELERAKKSIEKIYEQDFNEREKKKSKEYAQELMRGFLIPRTNVTSVEYDYELIKKYLPTITLEEINNTAKKYITDDNCVIFAMAPEKSGFKLPTEAQMLAAYQEANQKSTEPYVDKVADRPLVNNLGAKGKVAKKEVNKNFGYETWTLKNGVKVVIKPTTFKADEISMYVTSEGGYSKFNEADIITAKNIIGVMGESGLGNYDATELQKYMSGKNVSVTPFIDETSEGLVGKSSVSDFESMLELTNAYFTSPRFNESAFTSYMEKVKGMLENAALDPETAFRDTLSCTMSNYHPYNQPITAENIEKASFKNMKRLYNQRFNDPCNFTFYFVGNIYKKQAKTLVEKYLGSLETVQRNESYVDLGIRPPKGGIEKEVCKGKDAKCTEYIVFHGEFDYNVQSRTDLDAICKILSTRLLEEIREKESGVYTVGAYPSTSTEPYESYQVIIFYTCDPEREAELKEKIFDVIKSVQGDSLTEVDVQKVIEKKVRELETRKQENSYWRSLIISLNEGKVTEEEILNEEAVMKAISVESMKAAANKFFKFDSYIKVKLVKEK